MLTNTSSLDKIVTELDSKISDKEAVLDSVLDEIVQLKMRRERILGTLRELAGSVDSVAHPPQSGRRASIANISSDVAVVP